MICELPSTEASTLCARLITRLPEWFGIPEANTAYVEGVTECLCLGAFDPTGVSTGMVALRAHFGTTLEIWWMAVDPDHHRKGVGATLVAAAIGQAKAGGFRDLVLMTLSEECDDPAYAGTRAFYVSQGFRPLVHDHMGDPETPLMWMIRPVDGG